MQSLRRLIEDLEEEIELFERLTRGRLVADPGYTALQQLPGIGPILAAVFIAEVGDVTRFHTAAQLACWAGLTPKHHESDTHVHRGRITKQGSRLVRWAAVESVKRLGPTTVVGAYKAAGRRPARQEHRHRRRRPQADRVRLLRAARPPRPRTPPATHHRRRRRHEIHTTSTVGREAVQVMTPGPPSPRWAAWSPLLIDPDRPSPTTRRTPSCGPRPPAAPALRRDDRAAQRPAPRDRTPAMMRAPDPPTPTTHDEEPEPPHQPRQPPQRAPNGTGVKALRPLRGRAPPEP